MTELSGIQHLMTEFELRLRKLDPSGTASLANLLKIREQLNGRVKGIRAAIDRSVVILSALKAREARLQLVEKRTQIEKVKSRNRNARVDIGSRSKRNLDHDFLGTAP